MNTEIYKRSTELLDKYTTFIQSINQENLQKNITVQNLFSLKSVLSNINNVLTLLATLAIARKIIEIFNIGNKQKEDILLEYLRYFENKLKYYTELHSMAENEQDNDVIQSSLKAIDYTSELIEKVQSDLFALTDDEKYDIEDNKEN